MNKIIILLISLCAIFCLYNCTSADDLYTHSVSESSDLPEETHLLTTFVYNSVAEMYTSAYENGELNPEKEKEILIQCAYDATGIDITPVFQTYNTRNNISENSLEHYKNELSKDQYTLLEELISIKSPTIDEILSLKQKVYTINKNEQEKFIYL
ncbi:MAG: hypothetical protein LIP08_00150 [Bacteroides sp.]|nr:hypothetical protein [Bacteroides sp.]